MYLRTREILFKLNLDGNGIVNFDDTAQKIFLSKNCQWQENYKNDNLKFSKKAFYKEKDNDGNEVTKYKVKIDSTCLRHALFERDCKISNPKVMMNDELFAYYVSSIVAIVRGFMYTNKKDIGFARSSAITITSAIENGGAVPYMEVHSNYCADGTSVREEKDDKKKTSFYYSENVGDTFYEAKGAIDLSKLQFMSCDPQFGRMSFKSEWIEGENNLFEKVFKEHYGQVPYEVGYYNTNTGTYRSEFSEQGIKFNDQFVRYLLKEILQRLATLKINRSMGYANVCALQCKAVTDGFSTFDDNGWVNIENEEDINQFVSQIEIDDIYIKTE